MSQICFLVALLSQASLALGGSGLRGPAVDVSKKEVENSLLAELAASFKTDPSARIAALEEALRPMYMVVPKEAGGSLGHSVVRYVLHRFFVKQHGWFIRGLEPGSGSQNVSGNGTLQQLQEWVPSYLQKFVEETKGDRGISLRELAAVAATLEDLVHKESVKRLGMAFNALELPHDTKLNEARLKQALEVYMMIYMLGGKFNVKGEQAVLRAHKVFATKVRDWTQVQEWMHSIQLEVAPDSAQAALNFSAAATVVEEVGRRYGTYNDAECNSLKSELLQIESTKAGRVRLPEFYKKGLTGVFEFNEKIDYLRTLGAVDETDPQEPFVIVPNYVAARPNCLDASSFYAVCCRNECEDLMGKLEDKLKAHTAKPEQILQIVEALSSATVQARKIPESMVGRLNKIADSNEGVVPLHGRLFAQWMHHAFPRECPYPQQAGTTAPQTPDEWMQATGQQQAKKSKEEMQAHVDSDTCTAPVGDKAREQHHLSENALPWDDNEELLVPVVWQIPEETVVSTPARSFRAAPVVALVSFAGSIAVMAMKLLSEGKQGNQYLSFLDSFLKLQKASDQRLP
jgi:hypothetical protein